MFANKRILVTGGAGAIGSNLLEELIKHQCEIIVLDDLTSGYVENIPKSNKIIFIKGSITDDEILKKIFTKKINIIFHLAAFFANQNSVDHPDKDLNVNGYGTLKLLQFASKQNIERFIYASSSCVYGDVQTAAIESHKDFHLDTPYAITKLLGEYYVKYYHENHNLPTTILRFFNSFGPGEKPGKYRNVIPNFMWRAMHDKPLIIFGTGDETRDFNWVKNTVQALILSAIKEEAVGEVFNVGSGKETKIKDIANAVCKAVGKKPNIVYKPRRSWDTVLRRKANIEKTQKLLGYKPDTENFAKKLDETFEWMKKMTTKKILILSPRQWDLQWGQEKDLINSLISSYEVTLLELLDYSNLTETYVAPNRTTVVKRKTKYKPGLKLGWITEWRNFKDSLHYDYDIFITYLTAGALLATITAKLRGKKILLIYADDMPELHRSFSYIGYFLTKYLFNPISALLANKIVATAKLLVKDITYFGKKAVYIPNGVDFAAYASSKKHTGQYTIGYVGGFGDWVNFDLLIESARKLPKVKFVIIGDGVQFNYVKHKTNDLKNVKLTGMLSIEAVKKELEKIDVCTIPFKVNRLTNRISPIKLFEYWATKKPVISTSFYEVKMIGKDIVSFADNTTEFIEQIKRLQDKSIREKIAKKSYNEAKKYDWQRLSSQYHEILEEI